MRRVIRAEMVLLWYCSNPHGVKLVVWILRPFQELMAMRILLYVSVFGVLVFEFSIQQSTLCSLRNCGLVHCNTLSLMIYIFHCLFNAAWIYFDCAGASISFHSLNPYRMFLLRTKLIQIATNNSIHDNVFNSRNMHFIKISCPPYISLIHRHRKDMCVLMVCRSPTHLIFAMPIDNVALEHLEFEFAFNSQLLQKDFHRNKSTGGVVTWPLTSSHRTELHLLINTYRTALIVQIQPNPSIKASSWGTNPSIKVSSWDCTTPNSLS